MRDLSKNENAIKAIQSRIYQEANEYEKKPEHVRLAVREKDKQFFKKHVLEKGGTKIDENEFSLSDSQVKIKLASKIFTKKFKFDDGTLNHQLLDEMIMYVLNNTVLVYVKTSNITSAFRLFSVLNARGMDLTTSDLLKSENLSSIVESDREEFQRIWETIEDELGREDLDKLIGFIRTIFVKEKAKKATFDEFDELIFKKDPLFKGKNFINYLSSISDIYKEKVLNADLNYEKDSVLFFNLMTLMRNYLKASDWIPVFIFFYKKFPNEENLLPFLRKLERKFVLNWIRGLSPTERIVDMNRILSVIEQMDKVNDILNNKIFDTTLVETEFESIINDTFFYGKKYCTYILLRLDLALSENSNVKKSYKNVISVEHILPQTPNSNSIWAKVFTEGERFEWTNKIGNLVLLSRKKNSSANNKSFEEKKSTYYKNGITDFELTKEISNYNEWNSQSIANRQNQYLKKLKTIWIEK